MSIVIAVPKPRSERKDIDYPVEEKLGRGKNTNCDLLKCSRFCEFFLQSRSLLLSAAIDLFTMKKASGTNLSRLTRLSSRSFIMAKNPTIQNLGNAA